MGVLVIIQESHQRDKHVGCPPCKIFGTTLDMNKGKVSTNLIKGKSFNMGVLVIIQESHQRARRLSPL